MAPLQEIADEYRRDAEDDRPLGGYTALLSGYAAITGALVLLGRRRLPGRLGLADLAMGSLATHKIARRLTEEPITSPVRAPFTRYQGVSGPSELAEGVRGTGLRHAVGELLTCPFCMSQWVATSIVVGLVVTPRFTRTALSVFTMVTASDALHLAYARAQQSVDG